MVNLSLEKTFKYENKRKELESDKTYLWWVKKNFIFQAQKNKYHIM